MQVIRNLTAITGAGAVDDAVPIADPELRALIHRRLDDLGEDADLVRFIIVEPEDAIADINQQLEFDILANRWDGTRWGDADFTPAWEILVEHPGWYELVFVTDQAGSGVIVFLAKQGLDDDLSAMLSHYCREGP